MTLGPHLPAPTTAGHAHAAQGPEPAPLPPANIAGHPTAAKSLAHSTARHGHPPQGPSGGYALGRSAPADCRARVPHRPWGSTEQLHDPEPTSPPSGSGLLQALGGAVEWGATGACRTAAGVEDGAAPSANTQPLQCCASGGSPRALVPPGSSASPCTPFCQTNRNGSCPTACTTMTKALPVPLPPPGSPSQRSEDYCHCVCV